MLGDEHVDEQRAVVYLTLPLVLNDWIIVNNVLEGVWKEVVVVVLLQFPS
jgi:hypothetical protein